MKREKMEFMNESSFCNQMTLRKAGHIGVLLMAMHVAGNVKNKWSKILLLVSMGMLLLDDVEIIIHYIKKPKEVDEAE